MLTSFDSLTSPLSFSNSVFFPTVTKLPLHSPSPPLYLSPTIFTSQGVFFFIPPAAILRWEQCAEKPSLPHKQNSLRKEWSETGASLKTETSIPSSDGSAGPRWAFQRSMCSNWNRISNQSSKVWSACMKKQHFVILTKHFLYVWYSF